MFFLWLIFYGTVMLLARHLQSVFPWALPLGYALNSIFLILWICKQKGLPRLSITHLRWNKAASFCLLIPAAQLLCFGFPDHTALSITTICLAALQEELFFRGIVLPFFSRKSCVQGILISAALFAGAHLLNLESAITASAVLFQCAYALTGGLALSGLCLSCGHLIPPIMIHCLTNLTASESASGFPFWICLTLWLICGIYCLIICTKNSCSQNRITQSTLI